MKTRTTSVIILLAAFSALTIGCSNPEQKSVLSSDNSNSKSGEAVSLSSATLEGDELIKTSFGDIELTESYLTKESIEKLNDQLQLQRAIEVYQWSLPLITFQMWYNAHNEVYGAAALDFVEYNSFEERLGIVTGNTTTPYVLSWVDLSQTGPLVIDYPAGPSAGAVTDFFQLSVGDFGYAGADKGNGGKYLIIPPAYDKSTLDATGYFVISPSTNKILIGTRFLSPDKAVTDKMKESFLIGSYGESLKPAKFISNTDKRFRGHPDRGLKYFELVHQFIQNEPQKEEDKIFFTYLRYLGIENGKPFNPSASMKTILAEGANLGELMCRANSIIPRQDKPYYENSSWYRLLTNFPITKSSKDHYFLDESNEYYYEAITVSAGMTSNTPGPGTTSYLTTKEDKDGNFLLGSNTYKFHLPPGIPASNFWSVVLYSLDTRCIIENVGATDKLRATSVDSRDKNLKINADGSVDLYFGPKAPEGKESNWIQTNAGEGWFPYIRTYGTEQAFFDKTWQPDEIEKIN